MIRSPQNPILSIKALHYAPMAEYRNCRPDETGSIGVAVPTAWLVLAASAAAAGT